MCKINFKTKEIFNKTKESLDGSVSREPPRLLEPWRTRGRLVEDVSNNIGQ